jgi:predicted helicase
LSQLLIHAYFNEIDRLKKFSGSKTEGIISEAFKDLLKAWAKQNSLIFLSQYEFESPQKNRIRPDGTIVHELRVPLGYWEAKDTDDDLEKEITKKFAKGYPQDNIIFEDSVTAVLFQNKQEVMRCSMVDANALTKLVALFFSYERVEIAEFRKAVAQFRADLPAVLNALREKIEAAYSTNTSFKTAADEFLAQAKQTINPSITEADIQEMLIQHILTEEIFAHVFNESDFHRDNNIAKSLYALEAYFFTGGVKRDTLKALEPYYAAIRANAAQITSHAEKQTFLKLIYENFYKVYNPKAADRLGVVYTPNEIVKFMIEGADWLCHKHFGKSLIDKDVEILDPATGTGTFICELLEHFRGQPQKLTHKYKHELFANEVAILPYYVANLNIEATFAAISGQYAEFPNLCFVDTLDNVAGLGIKSGHQHDMFGAMSDENVERIKRQNTAKISVVIGNPPYNANQQNENDNNKNRNYSRIDERIKATYIKQSTAQKTKLYDMYARFFRWASDRMHDDGVLAFVTNRSFIDSRTFDGFRKIITEEFSDIYVVDLGGDVRANPKLSGTKNNVFGIQTGVAISFFVKKKTPHPPLSGHLLPQGEKVAAKQTDEGYKKARIYYARRPEMETATDKLSWLSSTKASELRYEHIAPDAKQNWLNLTDNDWDTLLPVVDKATKAGKGKGYDKAIFKLFSLGVVTARDEWVYDLDKANLIKKAKHLITVFEHQKGHSDIRFNESIKWSENLKRETKTNRSKILFKSDEIVTSSYRPFYKQCFFSKKIFSDRLTEHHYSMFGLSLTLENKIISTMGDSSGKPFFSLIIDRLPDLNFVSPASGGTRCFPRYRYNVEGERIDNITDWALTEFQKAYAGLEKNPSSVLRTPSPSRGEGKTGAVKPTAVMPVLDTGIHVLTGEIKEDVKCTIKSAHDESGSFDKKPITKDAIFHYVYGVLHDPIYRTKYAQNLKRDFPRIPFYPDFWQWAAWGEQLMALHIGYETQDPWSLTRLDVPNERARANGVAPTPKLKSDPDSGIIILDSETQLTGIPLAAWDYRLGNRSALDWILDQHKEKTPKDPTIREKFNTYRFADYKEKVVDLITRVTRVSVETIAITTAMRELKRD